MMLLQTIFLLFCIDFSASHSLQDIHVHLDMGNSSSSAAKQGSPLLRTIPKKAGEHGKDYGSSSSEETASEGTDEEETEEESEEEESGSSSAEALSCEDCDDLGVAKFHKIWDDDQCPSLGMLINSAKLLLF